jgi:hypothetical protein
MPCKLASLEVVITPLLGELVIPDPRWITCAIGAASVLLAGWIRAARRRPDTQ